MLRLSTSITLTAALAFGSASSLAACGSSSTSDIFTGKPAQTNSAEQDAAADESASQQSPSVVTGTTASDASLPPAPRDAGDPCVALRAQVDRLRSEAMSCSITSLAPQCNVVINDVCCKVVVTKDTQPTKNFVDAVKAFKAASCTVDCTKAQCSDVPTYVCQPMSGAKGICEQ